MGSVLRLHGDPDALQDLMALAWLQGMRDHVRLTDLAPAPSDAPRYVVQRRQFKTSAERLRRRRMRRKGETADQAAAAIPDSVERQVELPFVRLNKRQHQAAVLPVHCSGAREEVGAGKGFNSYGLSQGGTVPWF